MKLKLSLAKLCKLSLEVLFNRLRINFILFAQIPVSHLPKSIVELHSVIFRDARCHKKLLKQSPERDSDARTNVKKEVTSSVINKS